MGVCSRQRSLLASHLQPPVRHPLVFAAFVETAYAGLPPKSADLRTGSWRQYIRPAVLVGAVWILSVFPQHHQKVFEQHSAAVEIRWGSRSLCRQRGLLQRCRVHHGFACAYIFSSSSKVIPTLFNLFLFYLERNWASGYYEKDWSSSCHQIWKNGGSQGMCTSLSFV